MDTAGAIIEEDESENCSSEEFGLIYLFCFFISTIMAAMAAQSHKKASFVFWSILSVFITAFLAGVRDVSIGIDTAAYFRTWNIATSSSSLAEYIKWYSIYGSGEYLYALFMGTTAQIFQNYNAFLFLSSLITVGAVYIGAFRLKDYIYPPMALLAFYLLYYNYSFNAIRQMMAIAIQFAFLSDLLNKKYLKYLIAIAIAAGIHATSWMALVIMFSFMFLYGKGKETDQLLKNTRKKSIEIIAGIIIFSIGFEVIITYLINRNILSQKYLYYFGGQALHSPKLANAFFALEFVFLLIFFSDFKKKINYSSFFIVSTFSFFILYQLASTVAFGKRISEYYGLLNIVTICLIGKAQSNKNSNRMIVSVCIIMVLIFYWFYVYCLRNASATYPYISIFSK